MIIVWFRNDLRIADNPALVAAVETGMPILPVYIHAPEDDSPWQAGGASNWWLHHSLVSLNESLRSLGSKLSIFKGPGIDAIRRLVHTTKVSGVFWNRKYEPTSAKRDSKIEETLLAAGIKIRTFSGSLLFEPESIRNKAGQPFQVFTPYWKTCLDAFPDLKLLPGPDRIKAPSRWPGAVTLDSLNLLPTAGWESGIGGKWKPGEAGAHANLSEFIRGPIRSYDVDRNLPDLSGTSRLSPHLHFGEISPKRILAAIRMASGSEWKRCQFVAEIGWREFAHHLLHHFPHTPESPLRANFARFPWCEPGAGLDAWQRGLTGYPLVDAGMRELWATGWMHNRVRMVVGSFLVKDLLIDWRHGAKWFWDTLVDADLANNTLGWQWVAGCGADASPFFRIFNPVSQGEKFDLEGNYIRRWVPELKGLPGKWIHKPWEASDSILSAAKVTLGRSYPERIVDHSASRTLALEAYASIRRN